MWVLYAVLSTLLLAAAIETNRVLKTSGLALNFWRTACATGVLALALPLMIWPDNPLFYAVAAFDGITSVWALLILTQLAAQKLSRVSAMYVPIATYTGFILWFFVDPALFSNLVSSWQGAAVILAFMIVTIAILDVRQNDIGWSSFKKVVPVGVLFGAGDVMIKYVVDPHVDIIGQVLALCFFSYLVSFMVTGTTLMRRGNYTVVFNKTLVKAGAITGLAYAGFLVCLQMAIVLAPSPAYPGIIGMCLPVWIMLYHKWRGIPDDANPKAGLAIVCGAVILALATL